MKSVIRLLLIFFVLFSCSEDNQHNPHQNTMEPAVTGVGIPDGAAVTTEIGPSGGSLSSADGILEITIPPGAVTGNTTFGVQPITNFCPGGKSAYRLLPEGLTFANPVTLTFHYGDEDIAGTLPEFLGIAYQGGDKIWYRLPSAVVDDVSKTISVQVKHFTDWTYIAALEISPSVPAVPELQVNETLNLSVSGLDFSGEEEDELPPLPANPPDNPSANEDYLPPLPHRQPFRATWYVNNVQNGNAEVGTITFLASSGDQNIFTYKAPATAPVVNPVLIKVEITGLRQWTMVGGNPRVTTRNMVILFKRIKIIDEFDFNLKVEAVAVNFQCNAQQDYYDSVNMDVHVAGRSVTISNISNHAASIVPETVSLGEGCTMTCIGGVGRINVSSATGTITEESGKRQLRITLLNKGAVIPVSKILCNGEELTTPSVPIGDESVPMNFVLKDSAQVINNLVWMWRLTPK